MNTDPLLFNWMDPKFSAAVANASSLVQLIGFITSAPGVTMGLPGGSTGFAFISSDYQYHVHLFQDDGISQASLYSG